MCTVGGWVGSALLMIGGQLTGTAGGNINIQHNSVMGNPPLPSPSSYPPPPSAPPPPSPPSYPSPFLAICVIFCEKLHNNEIVISRKFNLNAYSPQLISYN